MYSELPNLVIQNSKPIMTNTLASSVYARKYKTTLSFDEFLSYLNYGMKLLKRSKPRHLDQAESIAMEIALEYNMEQVMKQVSFTDDYE